MIFHHRRQKSILLTLGLWVMIGLWMKGALAVESHELPASFQLASIPQTGAVRLETDRQVYSTSEEITLNYSGMPGNDTDWITIVPEGSPETAFAFWTYTHGATDGQIKIPPQRAGRYEIRAFFDYPEGGYQIRAVLAVAVEGVTVSPSDASPKKETTATEPAPNKFGDGSRARLGVDRSFHEPGESIAIYYSGLPGHQSDWITIVPADAPDDSYQFWEYTHGKVEGVFRIPRHYAGRYEVRLYFNWPDGRYTVQDRVLVTVRNERK